MFTRLVHIYFLVFSFVWLVFTHTRSFGSSLLVRLIRVRVLEVKNSHIFLFVLSFGSRSFVFMFSHLFDADGAVHHFRKNMNEGNERTKTF